MIENKIIANNGGVSSILPNAKKLHGSPIVYFVSNEGHAEWVLFLHAAFVHHEMFKDQFAYFLDKYNILAVDIMGHGLSLETGKGDGIDRMADWIAGIMQVEGIDSLHVVGVSLGAVLAQDFANRYPDAVRSLACFGGYNINDFDARLQRRNAARQMGMLLKALFSVKWFAKSNKKISACTPHARDAFFAMNLRFRRKSFMFLAGLNKLVNRYPLAKRNYPLLIGCGHLDDPMALEALRAWQVTEPDCKCVVFENAGHCVNMDVPQAFNRTLEGFWETASTPR